MHWGPPYNSVCRKMNHLYVYWDICHIQSSYVYACCPSILADNSINCYGLYYSVYSTSEHKAMCTGVYAL